MIEMQPQITLPMNGLALNGHGGPALPGAGLPAPARPRSSALLSPRPLPSGRFRQIAVRGFGNGENSYPWGSTWFDGKLYIGTAKNMLVMIAKRFPYKLPMPVWPVPLPESDKGVDLRGEVWRYDPDLNRWDQIFISPMTEGIDGRTTPLCCGFRNLAVFQGRSDRRPMLYSIPGCGTYGKGPVVLRSEDGARLEVVSEPGLGVGDDSITSYRGLIPFKGRLWACPSGTRGAQGNVAFGCVIVSSDDPNGGRWDISNTPGFGDHTNQGIFDVGVFGDYLYAGTINVRKGCQLWKTDGEGKPPFHWTKVADYGFFRGPHNEMVMSFAPYRDALYLGTGIQNGGHDRVNSIGRQAGEVIRVWPDDSWELVMGEPRQTPIGLRIPTSGLGPGFSNFMAGYIWRMTVHQDVLYVGTFDAGAFLPYASRDQRPDWLNGFLDPDLEEKYLQRFGGGELWRTGDGDTWVPVTRNGFGNPFNYGIRALLSTPRGLFVGMANPFGPRVAVKGPDGYRYEDNPRGGIEVWHGSPDNPWNADLDMAEREDPAETDSAAHALADVGSPRPVEPKAAMDQLFLDVSGGEDEAAPDDLTDAAEDADSVTSKVSRSAPEEILAIHRVAERRGSVGKILPEAEAHPFVGMGHQDKHFQKPDESIEPLLTDFFSGSAVRNIGYWRSAEITPRQAALQLVEEMLVLLDPNASAEAATRRAEKKPEPPAKLAAHLDSAAASLPASASPTAPDAEAQPSTASASFQPALPHEPRILLCFEGALEACPLVRSRIPGARVSPLLPSRKQLRRLRRSLGEGLAPVAGSPDSIGAGKAEFDCVLVIEPRPARARKVWKECARVLRPGGLLVVADALGVPEDRKGVKTIARSSPDSLLDAYRAGLSRAGFTPRAHHDIFKRGWSLFARSRRRYFELKRLFHHIDDDQVERINQALPGRGLLVQSHFIMLAEKAREE